LLGILASKALLQVMLRDRVDVTSQHAVAHQSANVFMEEIDSDVQTEISLAGNQYAHHSPNFFNSSAAPASPILSSSDFLQRFHIHLSPNSLVSNSLNADTFTSSPVQRPSLTALGSNASNASRAFTLKLPLPMPDPLPGENEDLDC
jgi:hypothetical protein